MILPLTPTTYTCTGSEETHVFAADMTEAVLHAKDGNVAIGSVTGTLDFTIMSGEKIAFQNRAWRGQTLFFQGTGTKIFEILEHTGLLS